jgi:Leucine-rich repeat (LRR) protein
MNYTLTVIAIAVLVVGDTTGSNAYSETPTDSGRVLDVSGQGLAQVPDSVFNRTDVEVLDVSNNQLDGALQAEVRHLRNLRVLDLSNNNFTGVPAEVGQLTKLEVLDLSNNPIAGLPHEIGNLRNLHVLDLRGTNYAKQDLDVIQQRLPSDVEVMVD